LKVLGNKHHPLDVAQSFVYFSLFSNMEGSVEESTQLGTPVLPDYPGIEYPPAFEPETYTLQYMLDRKRRDAKHKK